MHTYLPTGFWPKKISGLTGVATIISRLFDPPFVFTGLMTFVVVESNLSPGEQLRFLMLFFTVIVGIPLVLMLAALRQKTISDWDLGNRIQRVKALRILLFLAVVDVLVVYWFGNTHLTQTFAFFCIWLVGFFAITNWWKLSGHTGMAALAGGFLTYWYGWWPILLVVPLVAWARVYRRDHTLAQTIAGAVYSWVIFLAYVLLLPVLPAHF